jgi:hypothetical protein
MEDFPRTRRDINVIIIIPEESKGGHGEKAEAVMSGKDGRPDTRTPPAPPGSD